MATQNSVNNELAGQEGTGKFVGDDSPTLTTPDIGAATGTSINLSTSTTVSSVLDEDNMVSDSATALSTQQSIKAYVDASVAGDNPTFETVTFIPTTSGIVGTTTNDNASTGIVGEVKEQESEVTVSTGVISNIASLALDAGDWEVWGGCATSLAGGATITAFTAWVNNVSATEPTPSTMQRFLWQGSITGNLSWPVVRRRFSLSSTTTIYLSGQANFATGSVALDARITARRIR